MINVLAPSTTAGRGQLEIITLHHEPDGANAVVFDGLTNEVDPEMMRQATLARRCAAALLAEDWLQFLVERDIAAGRITIRFAEVAEREQSSFGLAFLVGMLALALDAAIREGRAFTGEILDTAEDESAPGAKRRQLPTMALRQIGGLDAKTRACADAGCGTLYYPFEQENTDIARAELEYWPGVRPRACRLTPLNPRLPVASLLNLAIDFTPLWRRAEAHVKGPRLAFHLLEAMRVSSHQEEFPAGVGRFLAGLRKQGAIDQKSDEAFRASFDRWRAACPPESIPELLKAVISKDPSWPLDVSTVEAASPDAETDIARWLNGASMANGAELGPMLAILHVCHQVATDFGPYQSAGRRMIIEAIGLIKQAAESLPRTPSIQQLGNLVAFCRRFVERAQDIEPRELTALIGVLEKVRDLAEQLGPSGQRSLQGAIATVIHQIHLATIVAARGVPERDPRGFMQVEFSRLSHSGAEIRRFTPVNDLQVTFQVGNSVLCTLPSPVLLFDSSWQQCPSFSRRAAFALADDAMHRLPLNEMNIIRDLWGRGGERIGFRFSEGSSFSVHWEPSLGPWPPSIDAQLFVSAMAKNAPKLRPRTFIDLGTGTGYLAAAALSLWPSIERVALIESLPMSLALACANVIPMVSPHQGLHWQRARVQDLAAPERVDLVTCAPPYLPERPLVPEGIEMATNGTSLLEYIVGHGPDWAREIWVSFSVLAWREFLRALLAAKSRYRSVAVLSRDFVPFRIPWLEPRTPEEGGGEGEFAVRLRYYESILLRRGLIDLDSSAADQRPEEYLAEYEPGRWLAGRIELQCDRGEDQRLDKILNTLREDDSRGYRFWHEVRCLRLVANE